MFLESSLCLFSFILNTLFFLNLQSNKAQQSSAKVNSVYLDTIFKFWSTLVEAFLKLFRKSLLSIIDFNSMH